MGKMEIRDKHEMKKLLELEHTVYSYTNSSNILMFMYCTVQNSIL